MSVITRTFVAVAVAMVSVANISILSPAHAQGTTNAGQATAHSLLTNMRRALATILVVYKTPSAAKSHAGSLVLNGTKEAAVEIDGLTAAVTSRKPRAISEATRKTAEAIGRLDGIFRMAGSTDPRAAEGMRALSANWATYTARYALARPAQSKARATATQVAELQRNVASLRGEVDQLRRKARHNARVVRDLDVLYARIDRLEQRRITEDTYHSTLVALSAVNGLFVGYEVVSRVYYPDIYTVLHDRREQFAYYQGYWDGYYDAYYESWPTTYYEAPFEAPDVTVVNIDVTINEQVENHTTQNIDVFVQEAEATEATFEVAPTPRDVEQRPAFSVTDSAPDAADLVETVKPNAEVLQSLETSAPSTPGPPAGNQQPRPSPADPHDDDKPSASAPSVAAPETRPRPTDQPKDTDHEPGERVGAPSKLSPPPESAPQAGHAPAGAAPKEKPDPPQEKNDDDDDDGTSSASAKPSNPDVTPPAEDDRQRGADHEPSSRRTGEASPSASEEGEWDDAEPPSTGSRSAEEE